MLKNFKECFEYDLSGKTLKKPTFYKDQSGKMQKQSEDRWLDYVEWAVILHSLYDLGAESVSWSSELSETKVNTLVINLNIDGVEYITHYPVIDGNKVIKQPSQMELHKAELRGFVKAVAINTGLGLSLWMKEEINMAETVTENARVASKKGNMDVFLTFQKEVDKAKTKAQLTSLYKANAEVIESNPAVKNLFIKAGEAFNKKKQ